MSTWEEHFAGFDHFGATPFDPWPIVYMFERLRVNPDDAVYLDMWRAMFREQEAAQERWHGSMVRSPREQVHVASQCLMLRPAIEAGAGGPLLEAIALCAAHGIGLPAWVAMPYVERYWSAQAGAFKGWEEAFGPIRGTVKAREARAMGLETYRAALALVEENPDKALNSAFFAEVGAIVERGHSAVQEIVGDYIDANGAAPLLYVKQHLQSGGTLRSAESTWLDKRMEQWLATPTSPPESR